MRKFRRVLTRSKQAHVRRIRRWRRHPLSLPVLVFVGLLFASGAGIFGLSAVHKPISFHPDTSYIAIISYDHQIQTVPTKEPTVGALLKKLKIRINPRDRVEPSRSTRILEDNFRINIYRAVPVTITDGVTTTTAFSAAATPRSIVTDAGVPLYPEDTVTASPAVNLVSQQSLGERIVINRATPITLNDYGTELPLRTHAKTVGQLLSDEGIHLRTADTVIPSVATSITPNMQVIVNRKGTKIVTTTQTIPAPVQTVPDMSLSFGTSAVRQQGSNGTRVLTYQVNTENGKAVGQTLLQSVVTVQPVPEIIARGKAVSIPADKQAVMAEAGIPVYDYPYVNYIVSHESGWCPTKLQGEVGYCPGYAPTFFPVYLGYGLVQATPGTKMDTAGSDWRTNPVTQLRWASSYAIERYGSWAGAYDHWSAYHNW